MARKLLLGGVAIEVQLKDIKNVHLSVNPPDGRVRISAPARTSLETIRLFAISKLGWIKRQQKKLREQDRESPRDYVDRESHFLWGRRYLLQIEEAAEPPSVRVTHSKLVLRVRHGTDARKRAEILETWYREQLKEAVPPLIATWQKHLGVRVERFHVQRMKTRWGSCNPAARSIRLSTELAKKPRECLEYIVVHEMIHLIEPTHGPRFLDLIERYCPRWGVLREQLNRLPVRHEDWTY
jgi:predicted metal-dependent hydrolase